MAVKNWLKQNVSKGLVSARFAEAIQRVIDAGPMPDSPARAALRQQMRAVESALFERAMANNEDGLELLAQSYRDGELHALSEQYWTLWRADADVWETQVAGIDFQAAFNKHLSKLNGSLDNIEVKMKQIGIWREG